MLSIYDFGEKYPITEATNFYITHKDGGLDTLAFNVQVDLPIYAHIAEENRVEYGDNDYVIKSIDAPGSVATVKCGINLDFLKERFYKAYDSGSVTLPALLQSMLPAGWTITGYDPGIHRTISLENATDYDVIIQAMDTYGVKFRWNTLGKTLTVIDPSDLTPSGEYLTDELNLRSIAFKGQSNDLITRLYPYGKDGLTVSNVNGGLEYVENHQYSSKTICASWKDERYTVAADLKAAAEKKLSTLAVPVRSYECDVIDLAKLDDRYAMFDFSLYKVVTLIDRLRKVRMNHQILEYKEYPEQPQKNIVTLSSVVGKIQTKIDKAINQVKSDVINTTNALQSFSNLMANAFGCYRTEEKQADGSSLFYIHDKALLTQSTAIWRMSAQGFSVSNDGGQTWNSGWTSDGVAVINLLSVVGVMADWIKVGGSGTNGVLSVKDENDNEIVTLDKRGVSLSNGAKLIGGNGVLSKFVFSSGNLQRVGCSTQYSSNTPLYHGVYLDYFIPNSFVIMEARVHLRIHPQYGYNIPVYTSTPTTWSGWGYPHGLKAYKIASVRNTLPKVFSQEGPYMDPFNSKNGSTIFTDITSTSFGISAITPTVNSGWSPSDTSTEFASLFDSTDVKNLLSASHGTLAFFVPTAPTITSQNYEQIGTEYSGYMTASLEIIGYTK